MERDWVGDRSHPMAVTSEECGPAGQAGETVPGPFLIVVVDQIEQPSAGS